MKYFYDTEFHEDGTTIDLISIGILAEDGREYYAVNDNADWDRIAKHEWLMANVVPHLPDEMVWKPKKRIAQEVKEFLLPAHGPRPTPDDPELWAWYSAYDHVALAQLWGPMADLPRDIPMYTNDIRSLVDWTGVERLPKQTGTEHDALADARHVKAMYEYIIKTTQAVPRG